MISGRGVEVGSAAGGIRDLAVTQAPDAADHGERGLRIRVRCRAVALKGAACEIAAFFSFPDGTMLKDCDGRYTNPECLVCVSDVFTADQDDAQIDGCLFIPYGQLHLADGRHSVRYHVQIGKKESDRWRVLVRSSFRPFQATWRNPPARPPAAVEVSEEFGVSDPILGAGARVAATFTVSAVALQEGQVAACFYDQTGAPLRDADGAYGFGTRSDSSGQVMVWTPGPLTPGRTAWRLFVPYAQLHLPPGRHEIQYVVFVFRREPNGTWTPVLRSSPRWWTLTVPAGA